MGERGWDKVIAICPSFTQTIIAKSKWEGVRGRGILILAGGGSTPSPRGGGGTDKNV